MTYEEAVEIRKMKKITILWLNGNLQGLTMETEHPCPKVGMIVKAFSSGSYRILEVH